MFWKGWSLAINYLSGRLSLGHLREEPRKHYRRVGKGGKLIISALLDIATRGCGASSFWKLQGARAKHKPQRCGARGLACLSRNSCESLAEGYVQGYSIPALSLASGLGLGQACGCGAGNWIWLVSIGWFLLVGDGRATSNFLLYWPVSTFV